MSEVLATETYVVFFYFYFALVLGISASIICNKSFMLWFCCGLLVTPLAGFPLLIVSAVNALQKELEKKNNSNIVISNS